MKSLATCTLSVASLLLVTASPAFAQDWGVRGGANINPDQVTFGAQYTLPLIDHLSLQPSGDIGVGNGATLLALNADVVRVWSLGPRSPWAPYAGGGPALNHYRLAGYSESELGVNALAGLRHSSGLFLEFRAGFLDSPDYRFGAGYTFQPRRPKTHRAPPRRR